MEGAVILKRLELVDRELHALIDELKFSRQKKSRSLSDLNKLMAKDRISDEDSTELIRRMRDGKYSS